MFEKNSRFVLTRIKPSSTKPADEDRSKGLSFDELLVPSLMSNIAVEIFECMQDLLMEASPAKNSIMENGITTSGMLLVKYVITTSQMNTFGASTAMSFSTSLSKASSDGTAWVGISGNAKLESKNCSKNYKTEIALQLLFAGVGSEQNLSSNWQWCTPRLTRQGRMAKGRLWQWLCSCRF